MDILASFCLISVVVLVMTLMSAVALSLLSLSTLMILSRNFASYAENTRLALK